MCFWLLLTYVHSKTERKATMHKLQMVDFLIDFIREGNRVELNKWLPRWNLVQHMHVQYKSQKFIESAHPLLAMYKLFVYFNSTNHLHKEKL